MDTEFVFLGKVFSEKNLEYSQFYTLQAKKNPLMYLLSLSFQVRENLKFK